jgi:hypothetical protein
MAGPAVSDVLQQVMGPLIFAGAVFLFVIAAGAWIMPGAGRPIEFTRSEVQFLFQAPVTRRQLLHYKLLRGQLGSLLSSAVATIFLRPSSFAAAWMFFLGLWILFAILRLHFMGVVLRRQSLAQHGRIGVAQNWLPLLIVGSAALVLIGTVAADWPRLSAMSSPGDVFTELRALGSSGLARWVLWPFAALVALPLSSSAGSFFRILPVVLLLAAANYLWVLRGDASFEEASAADAEHRAARRAAPRPVRRNVKVTPFSLALDGRPETAILWKNLVLLGRYASLRTLIRFVPVVVAIAIVLSRAPDGGGMRALVGTISLSAVAMAILIGPQLMRNDFRQDLAALAVLKTWPVRGAALVRGELLAPALGLSVLTWLLILIAALFIDRDSISSSVLTIGPRTVPQFAVAAAVVAPGLITVQLVLQNALAIVFPSWVAVGASRARGVDAMGQRLLMMGAIAVTVVLALLPAALVAGVIGFLLGSVMPGARAMIVLVPAVVVAVVLFAECWVASEILGHLFDRTDVSAIEAVE